MFLFVKKRFLPIGNLLDIQIEHLSNFFNRILIRNCNEHNFEFKFICKFSPLLFNHRRERNRMDTLVLSNQNSMPVG